MKKVIIFALIIAIILSLSACGSKPQTQNENAANPYDAPVVVIAKNMKTFLNNYLQNNISIINFTNTDELDMEEPPEYLENIVVNDNGNQLYIDNIENMLLLSTENMMLTYSTDRGFEVLSENYVDFSAEMLGPFIMMMNWVIENPDKFSYQKNVVDEYNIYGIVIEDLAFFRDKYDSLIAETNFDDVIGMAFHFYTLEDSTKLEFIEWDMVYEEGVYTIYTYLFDSPDKGYEEIGNNVEHIWEYTSQTIEDYKNANIMSGN